MLLQHRLHTPGTRCAALLFALLCATSWPARAHADEPVAAVAAELAQPVLAGEAVAASDGREEPAGYRTFVFAAIREHKAHNYHEAFSLFGKAHALLPNARTLRGLGVVSLDMKDYIAATGYLEAALASSDKPLDPALRASTSALLTRARSFVSRVHVVAKPANLSVEADGHAETLHGAALSLASGVHTLLFSAPGYAAEKRTIQVLGGEELLVHVSLAPAITASAPPVREETRPLRRSPWLWTGVSAIVLGGAITSIVLARRDVAYDGGSTNRVIGGRP